jgi:dihydrofolate reductase
MMMAECWPTADADPGSSGPEAEFAGIWPDMPEVVFSRTLQQADWNTTIVRDVVPDEIRTLKAEPGGDLVDEYRLYVHPVVLGRGKPLFPRQEAAAALDLIETRTFSNGVVLLRYGRRAPR